MLQANSKTWEMIFKKIGLTEQEVKDELEKMKKTGQIIEVENKQKEAFHLRDTHWVPVPESGTCPTTHPNKLKFPGTDTTRCFTDSAAAEVKSMQEQEPDGLTAQSYVLSKDRFKTEAEARKWMEENDKPVTKVDEKENTFRFRQFPPERCEEGSFVQKEVTDGVQILGCKLKPKYQEQEPEPEQPADQPPEQPTEPDTEPKANARPKNKRGFNVGQTLESVVRLGRKFTKQEANFIQKSPDPKIVCGACRFFLRDGQSDIGKCQVVEGQIPWFSTSDFYISAEAESVASLPAAE